MTGPARPQPDDLGAWLAGLEKAHAAATPGPWAQHPSDEEYVIGQLGTDEDGITYVDVGDTYAFRKREGSADAALIVAAVNALPRLIAAVRAAYEADPVEVALSGVDYVRYLIAAALSVPPAPEEKP